jgi:DNA-directed RNA polymerase subunit H (RpoH/RPB5)
MTLDSRRTNNVKEMMRKRGFPSLKMLSNGDMEAANPLGESMYVKFFQGKLDLTSVKDYLGSNFLILNNGDVVTRKDSKLVVQVIIICESFQKSHVNEFKAISKTIQLIRKDFFNIDITRKAPLHVKVSADLILKKNNLPILKTDDAMCTYHNFSTGDLVEITRSNGMICYRLVR